MGQFLYPDSWAKLSLAPVARAELISFVRDVAEWNRKDSSVKRLGADDLIGFFYDTYGADKGASYLIGGLLFSDEAECFDCFFKEFNDFLVGWERSQGDLDKFNESVLPSHVTSRAEILVRKLEERGVPEWRE